MKKLFLITFMLIGVSFATSAQLNKTAVDQMMKETGLSVDKMESLYVSNLLVFYKSGNFKKEDVKRLNSSDGYNRKFIITDVGIGFKSYKEGKIKGVTLYPYTMIKSIFISNTGIEIDLID